MSEWMRITGQDERRAHQRSPSSVRSMCGTGYRVSAPRWCAGAHVVIDAASHALRAAKMYTALVCMPSATGIATFESRVAPDVMRFAHTRVK